MNSLILEYTKALQNIYNHVGFVEDLVVYPVEDYLEYYWDTDGDTVFYAETAEDLKDEESDCYQDDVYKQRFYDKWIYEGKDFTMIFCDPHVDGVQWFKLFDNSKRVKI